MAIDLGERLGSTCGSNPSARLSTVCNWLYSNFVAGRFIEEGDSERGCSEVGGRFDGAVPTGCRARDWTDARGRAREAKGRRPRPSAGGHPHIRTCRAARGVGGPRRRGRGGGGGGGFCWPRGGGGIPAERQRRPWNDDRGRADGRLPARGARPAGH